MAANGNGSPVATTNGNGVATALTPGEKRHMAALEKKIERGLAVFREVGDALMEIRDNRLYRETHATFDAYVKERWHFERARAYQLIGAAEVARAIPASFRPVENEAQARELVPLVRENPSAVAAVWKQITESDEPISAPRIRQLVREHVAKPEPPPVPALVALLRSIERVSDQAKKWLETKPGRADRERVRQEVRALVDVVK
jgi:hypothetical protein